jgi:hypothetical protein
MNMQIGKRKRMVRKIFFSLSSLSHTKRRAVPNVTAEDN